MQRRARWLLDDMDRLILPPLDERLEPDAKGVAP